MFTRFILWKVFAPWIYYPDRVAREGFVIRRKGRTSEDPWDRDGQVTGGKLIPPTPVSHVSEHERSRPIIKKEILFLEEGEEGLV